LDDGRRSPHIGSKRKRPEEQHAREYCPEFPFVPGGELDCCESCLCIVCGEHALKCSNWGQHCVATTFASQAPVQQASAEADRSPMPALPIDVLIEALRQDPTLQNTLDAQAWQQLEDLHLCYRSSGDRRALVDGLSGIVGKMKLFSTVKAAAQEYAGANSPIQPSKRRTFHALPRQLTCSASAATPSPASSTSSGSPATPGGSEVATILSKHVRAGHAGGLTRAPAGGGGGSRHSTVRMLVHAFHCSCAACPVAKCAELKKVLTRMEEHASRCLALRTPLGTPMAQCKTCQLWRALDRTRRAASASRMYS